MRTMKQAARVSVLAVSLGLISGCATMSDVEQAEQRATAAANAARDAAAAAQARADEAAAAAAAAQSTADAAQTCCSENSQKIDSMFDRSMRK